MPPSVVDDPSLRKAESVVEEADPSLEATVLPSADAEEPPSEDAGEPDSAASPPSRADAEATAEEEPAGEPAPSGISPDIKKTPTAISKTETSASTAIPTRVRVGIVCWAPSSRTEGPPTVRAAARAESRGGSAPLSLGSFLTSLSATSPNLPSKIATFSADQPGSSTSKAKAADAKQNERQRRSTLDGLTSAIVHRDRHDALFAAGG